MQEELIRIIEAYKLKDTQKLREALLNAYLQGGIDVLDAIEPHPTK